MNLISQPRIFMLAMNGLISRKACNVIPSYLMNVHILKCCLMES